MFDNIYYQTFFIVDMEIKYCIKDLIRLYKQNNNKNFLYLYNTILEIVNPVWLLELILPIIADQSEQQNRSKLAP